jgi:hypothetical protein
MEPLLGFGGRRNDYHRDAEDTEKKRVFEKLPFSVPSASLYY